MKYKYAYVDTSNVTVVVACKQCPHWSAVRLDQVSARKAKADHDTRVHGVEPARASDALNGYLEKNNPDPE